MSIDYNKQENKSFAYGYHNLNLNTLMTGEVASFIKELYEDENKGEEMDYSEVILDDAKGTPTTLVSKCDNKGCGFNEDNRCTDKGTECFGYFVMEEL